MLIIICHLLFTKPQGNPLTNYSTKQNVAATKEEEGTMSLHRFGFLKAILSKGDRFCTTFASATGNLHRE